MPNPRISFRIPEEIYQQLPDNPEARSRFCLEAILYKLHPPKPEDELGKVKQQIANLEVAVQQMRHQLEAQRT